MTLSVSIPWYKLPKRHLKIQGQSISRKRHCPIQVHILQLKSPFLCLIIRVVQSFQGNTKWFFSLLSASFLQPKHRWDVWQHSEQAPPAEAKYHKFCKTPPGGPPAEGPDKAAGCQGRLRECCFLFSWLAGKCALLEFCLFKLTWCFFSTDGD